MRSHRISGRGLSVLLLAAPFALVSLLWLMVTALDRAERTLPEQWPRSATHSRPLALSQRSVSVRPLIGEPRQSQAGVQSQSLAATVPLTDGLEADLGFRPSVNGFSFANYTLLQSTVNLPKAPAAIELFGADVICKRGTVNATGTDCTLDAHVAELAASVAGSAYGQAYGMAGTALRFFLGKEAPSDIIPGAPATVAMLTLDRLLKEHIGRYTLQEGTAPTVGDHGWVRKLTAQQILQVISTELKNGLAGDPYLLMLYSKDGASSHALAPYRIVNTAPNQYDLYIYDSNFPLDDIRRIHFDLIAHTWTYSTRLSESGKVIDFSGSESTSLVDLRRLSAHQANSLKIIGAQSGTSHAASLLDTGEPVGFTVKNCFAITGAATFDNAPDANGLCNKLPIDGPVQCLSGSDGQAAEQEGRLVNRVCGTKPDLSTNLIFTLYSEPSGEKSLTLLTNAGNVIHLGTDAPSVAAQQASSAPTDTLQLALTPDTKTVIVTATHSSEVLPPLTFVVRGATVAQPSYTVEVAEMQLTAGRLVTLTTDTATGRLYLSDNDSNAVHYRIAITRQTPTGEEQRYLRKNFTLNGAAAYADFGQWDGAGAIGFVVDDEGNGFADDQATALINQANELYLPTIQR